MSDASLVEKGQSSCQITNDGRGLVLGEVDPSLDLSEQRPSVGLLKNEVKIVRVLEVVLQLDDLKLPPAEVVELDLLEDLGPGEGVRLLADDLNCEVVAGELEGARLHAAVAPLAQDLALEAVGLVEVGG